MKAHVLGKGVKAVGFLSVGEGHPHARGEGRVKDHSSTLKPRRQVHCGHCANTLPVQDDVLGADAVPAAKASLFKPGFKVELSVLAWRQRWPQRECCRCTDLSTKHTSACTGCLLCPTPLRIVFFLLTGSAGRARLHRYQRKGSSQKACQC